VRLTQRHLCRSQHLRRRPVRHSVRLACQVVRESDFRLVADQITNLSTFGLQVSPAESLITGEKLLVSFLLPRVGEWLDVEATVARVLHGRRPGETARALGLEFDNLRPYYRYLIRKELASAPPVPPTPRPGRRATKAALEHLAQHQAWLPTYAWNLTGG
jgi:hypothetical protein